MKLKEKKRKAKKEARRRNRKKAISQSQSLCAGEKEYVHQRKRVVLESLSSLGINCTTDSVPHIALLASGGGQRASVGLLGSLYQMEKEHLVDMLLYLGSVSGSTWSMSSIYSDPQWSDSPDSLDTAVSRLSGPEVPLEKALAWLDERAEEDYFSLSDVWGVLTSAGIMKQMDLRRLSDEASRKATNPYPIYSAIEKYCYLHGPIQGKWFEVTPHEAGFTELGLFVKTSLLGSKFENGKLLVKEPEMDMVKLQGILGSALALDQTIKDLIPPWLNVSGQMDGAAEDYLRVYNALDKLVALTRSTIKDPTALSDLDKLQKILEDMLNHDKSVWLESKSLEERKSSFGQWSLELMAAVQTWSQSLEDGAFKTNVSLLTKQVLPMIRKWEWGTTGNFLYKYQDSTVPPYLRSTETFHLIDAGLLINVAYPSFLGEKRDIDLIIAPEYSAGNMFETLTLARDYAAEVKKPFPDIDSKILEERDWPKGCYVLEGKEKAPTIVHAHARTHARRLLLPVYRYAAEFKAKMEDFSTFQRPYSQEKIEFELETAKANIKINKETLLREIKKAVLRRHNKM
ncbi:hypothetical protein PFLUV_G00183090 [Perca fluviatilis]|uniref:PLA2c domain-containing protein n=1 Tax=Perca fluviatilis TaxID=8168 RepID=A0A6A5ENY4_PERFL|nr:hypothetical protein PFLUV_G00183090 [Perca fluviatilis]